jgi:hypothetical protein
MPTHRELMEAERQRLLEQADQIERDMRELERLVTKYELCVIAVPPEAPAPEKFTRTNFSRAAKAAEAIIRAAGHPMTIHELFRVIQLERNIELIARDARGQLAATIISLGKLQSIKDAGWWIKGVPWPISPQEIIKLQEAPLPDDGPRQAGQKRSPEYQRVFEIVRAFLMGKDKPTKFADIMTHLETQGLAIAKDKKDRGRIAAFISGVRSFRSHNRAGWRYVPQFDDERPEAETPIDEMTAEPT